MFDTVLVTATVPSNTPLGTVLTNTAYVTNQITDTSSYNNTSSATTTVVRPQSDLGVYKWGNSSAVAAGDPIVWGISLSNEGSVPADSVVITDTLPAGLTYVILATTNLRDWTPVYTNVALSGSVALTDNGATNCSQRFYRATMQ